MKIWEYKHFTFFADDSMLEKYGKEGWEAYSAVKQGGYITIFLKRQKYKKNEK